MLNLCVNCNKPRIDGKTWKEKSGASVVTYTTTICPDADCQQLVDKAIADRKEKSAQLIKKKADAKIEREKLSAVN